jgi:prepilin-type N-terminal cleavage/methylation domain-containing protein
MRESNRGYTLVELIVSVAILGILVAAVGAFAVSGSRAYASVSAGVNLQVESQMTLGQLREYTLDCNTAVCGENNILQLLSREEDGSYTQHIFRLRGSELQYERVTYRAGESTPTSKIGRVSRYVESFTVTEVSPESVTVSLTLARRGKTYTATETLAMRNSPRAYDKEEDFQKSIPTT